MQSARQMKTMNIVLNALFIALVFVATLFLNIKLPIAANGGLVHLGSGMLFVITLLFGPKKGAVAGAFGMGLFDIVSGWALWAPFTFVTRGAQAYVIGKIAWANGANGQHMGRNIFAMLVGLPVMLAGYYICECILFKSFIIPFASMPGNLVQTAVGMIVAVPVVLALKKLSVIQTYQH